MHPETAKEMVEFLERKNYEPIDIPIFREPFIQEGCPVHDDDWGHYERELKLNETR